MAARKQWSDLSERTRRLLITRPLPKASSRLRRLSTSGVGQQPDPRPEEDVGRGRCSGGSLRSQPD
jgi:hypothetical protein